VGEMSIEGQRVAQVFPLTVPRTGISPLRRPPGIRREDRNRSRDGPVSVAALSTPLSITTEDSHGTPGCWLHLGLKHNPRSWVHYKLTPLILFTHSMESAMDIRHFPRTSLARALNFVPRSQSGRYRTVKGFADSLWVLIDRIGTRGE